MKICNEEKYSLFNMGIDKKTIQENKLNLVVNIDSNRHIYLKEHIFGDTFFIPATFIIEMMCEAGMMCYEGIKADETIKAEVFSVSNLEILRALKRKPGESIYIFIEVLKILDANFQVTISSERINRSGKKVGVMVNASANVIIMQDTPKGKMKFLFDKSNSLKYKIDKNILYEKYFSGLKLHFRTLNEMFSIKNDKTEIWGSYNCHNGEKTCIKEKNSYFLTSPLGNDACLQLAIALSRFSNYQGRLPIGVGYIRFYRKPSVDSDVGIYVQITYIDTYSTMFNIYSYDENGVCVAFYDVKAAKSPYDKVLHPEEEAEFWKKYNLKK